MHARWVLQKVLSYCQAIGFRFTAVGFAGARKIAVDVWSVPLQNGFGNMLSDLA